MMVTFDCQQVPEMLLKSNDESSLQFGKAVQKLAGFSLITMKSSNSDDRPITYSTHRLVSLATKN